jgi:hypothetical protein
MNYRVDTLNNRIDYLDKVKLLNKASWPEFLLYGDTPSWERIYDELSDFVILLIDSNDTLAGAGFTIAVSWNGNINDLPESIESIIVNGMASKGKPPNTLMAVAALVDDGYRGQNLSAEILIQMKHLAKHHNLKDLLVPVRPTWKARYPLQSIESYANWRRTDGLLYDPWLRTHERLGAELVKCVDSTYKVEGTIEEWQKWTGMIFPESGRYIIEGALEPIKIDIEVDVGVYHDPNVWMRHKVK